MIIVAHHRPKETKLYYCIVAHRTLGRIVTAVLISTMILLWLGAIVAHAQNVPGPGDAAPQPEGSVITGITLGVAVVSFVTTGLGYLLNYVLPFVRSEQAKGVMQWVYQAIAVALYQIVFSDDFGFNTETYVAFAEAIAVYGFAHGLLYKPPGWNVRLKAGQNRT